MAISDAQKVDYLFKKLGFGVTKTDTSTNKSPANESVSSPLLIRGDNMYLVSDQITNTATLPTGNVASVYSVYRDTLSSSVQATNDGTAAVNRTWKTGLTDWIGPEFGAGYQVKVYTGSGGSTSTAQTLTALPIDGSGNNDSWFFDYQSGVLNFADTNVPSSIGSQIWIVGVRYVGGKGVAALTAGSANTGNVAYYSNVNAFTTSQTFYPTFSNISTTGNTLIGVSSALGYNPSTGTLSTTIVNAAHNGSIGATTPNTAVFTTTTTGGLQAVAIGNVTPGTGVFTTLTAQTETVGGLQAVAIGNATPGTAVFTTATTGGLQAQAIGNVTPGTAVFTTATTGGLQAQAIGNATPGSGAFTTLTGGSFQGIIGNITPTTAFFTTANATNLYAATIGNATTALNGATATINTWANITSTTAATSATTGALIVAGGIGVAGNIYSGYTITAANIQTTGSNGNISGVANLFSANVIATNINAVTIGNTGALLTGSYGNITTINATNVNAVTIGNVGASVVGNGGFLSNIIGANVTGTVTTANVSMYDNVATITTNAVYYPQLADKSSGNVATVVATSVNVNPSTSTVSALGFVGGTGAFTTLNATGVTQITNATAATSTATGALQVTGGVGIGGNLWVGGISTLNGNVTIGGNLTVTGQSVSIGATTLSINDPIINLNTPTDLSPLTVPTTNDIGLKFHYYDTADSAAFVGRAVDSGYLEWYSRGTDTANVFVGTVYGTGKFGAMILANAKTVGGGLSANTGTLQVWGDGSVNGNLYVGGTFVTASINNAIIGNATAATAFFTTANATNMYAATIGNIGTYLKGDGSNITNLSLGSISGTYPTANVSMYSNVTFSTANQTYSLVFSNIGQLNGTSGNTILSVNGFDVTGASYNPSTGLMTVGSINTGALGTSSINNTLTIVSGGNIVAASSASSTSTTTGSFIAKGGAGVAGNLNVGGNVNITGVTTHAGNVAFDGVQVTHYDSIIDLHTYGNLAAWSSDDGKDIGLRLHYYNGADALAFVGLENSSKTLQFLINATEVSGNVTGTYGNIWAGSQLLSNTTASTSTTTGALQVAGGAGIAGNVYVGTNLVVLGDTSLSTANIGGLQAKAIGNITPGTGAFTTLSTTGNATIGGNISITGNIVPSANVTYSLGTTGLRFKDLWLSGQTEYLGGSVIGEDATGNLTLTTASGNRLTIASVSNVVVTTGNIATPYLLGNVYGTTGTFLGSGTSTSSTTGAVVVTGGVGVGGNLYVGTNTAITGTLGVTGATTMTTATTGGLQAQAIGNVTPGTYTFTTGNVGGLQAVAIGNINAGTGAFTTLTASTWANITATVPSTSTTSGALVVAGGAGIGGNLNAGTTSSIHTLQGNLLIGPAQSATSADSPFTINQNTDVPIPFANAIVHTSVLSGKTGFYAIDTYGTFASPVTSGFISRRSRGTSAAPSAVQAADYLGAIYFRGYGTTGYTTGLYPASGIRVGAAENYSDNSQATYMEFLTTNTGSNAASVSMFIDYTGNVVVNAATISTSTTTGALTVKGGVGIIGAVNIGGAATIGGNTAVNNNIYGRGIYDNGNQVVSTSTGSGSLSIINGNIALSSYGPGSQTVGSASSVPVITIDAYGRISAISTATVAAVATAANVAFYTQTVTLNNNTTFYPTFSNVNGGNSIPGTSSLLSYNPYLGRLTASAAAINGGISATSTTAAALVVSGGVGVSDAVITGGNVIVGNVVTIASTVTSASTGTGALIVAGGAGIAGNVYFGNAAIFNTSQTAGADHVVRGANDATLVWARPSSAYDTVIIGNSATASTVVAGAKLNINTTDSIKLPIGTNSQRPGNQGQTDVQGMFRYSTTQNTIEWYTGTQWNAATTQFTTITDEQFNGDGTTTDFTLAGTTTTAATIVSINGVIQIPTLAYSVVSSTTLRFTEAPAAGDVIDVRRLTTTSTVTNLSDATGYNSVDVDNTNGVTISTGTAAKNLRWRINTDGSKVSLLANTAVASANTATTIDTVDTTVYRSAKYVVQATNGSNYQVLEALLISNGTTATVMAYGTIQTAGNLGVVTATQSGSNAQLQFIALNSSTNVRITKEYLLI